MARKKKETIISVIERVTEKNIYKMILSAIESRNVFDRSSILRYFSPCTPYPAPMKFRARVEIGARSPGDRITPKKFTINFVSLSPLFLPFYSFSLSFSLFLLCISPSPNATLFHAYNSTRIGKRSHSLASIKIQCTHSHSSLHTRRRFTHFRFIQQFRRVFRATSRPRNLSPFFYNRSFILSLSLFHSLFPFSFFLQ